MLSTSADVALIDTSLPNFNQLSAAVSDRSNVILYDGKRESASKVLGKLLTWAAATKQQIHSVSILAHGTDGKFALGNDWISNERIQAQAWSRLKGVLADDANIYLFGCNVAAQQQGRDLLDHLATLSGADVYGSTNLTGKAGDWVLEAASKDAPAPSAIPLTGKTLAAWDFSLAAGITVSAPSGTSTTEAGGSVTFDVVLDEAPTDDVIVPIASNNTAGGSVSTPSLTFTADNWNTPQMVFTGTLASINAALAGMTFSPTADYNGPAAVQITTNDLGNTGWDGAQSDTDTVSVTVNPVNDAPVNALPPAQSTNEDTPLVFSTANGNRVSVSDVDVLAGTAGMTLSATNGTLSLPSLTGLTFITGDGAGDATMTFTSTLADINAALDGLSFTPSVDYNGRATLQITTSDEGNTGSGGALSDTDTVNIPVNAVNDAPVNTVPGAQSTNEDTPLVFSTGNGNAISVFDLDAGESTSVLSVTLTATEGLLTLGGLTGLTFITGDGAGDATMTITGTIADINAALQGLSFTPSPDFNGTTTIQITTDDLGNTGIGGALSITITVNGVNDAPTISAPATNSTNDTPLVFAPGNGNAITIGDVDAGSGPLRVTVSVNNGTLTLGGTTGLSFITGDGVGDSSVTFTGTLTDINNALVGLQFLPAGNYNGGASLQIAVNDQGNSGIGSALAASHSIALTINAVNDAPVNTVPGPQAVDEDGLLVFSFANNNRILVSDIDAGSASIRVTLTATDALLTLGGTTGLLFSAGDGVADMTMTFTGSINEINNALEGLSFKPLPNFAGPASLEIVTNDRGRNGLGGPLSDASTIAISLNPVNDAPTLTTSPGVVNYIENAPATVIDSGIVVGDVDDNELAGATIDIVGFVRGEDVLGFVNQNGITGSWDAETGVLSLSGVSSLANYQAALRSVTYFNTSDNPGTAPRTIRFVVGDGRLRSNAGQRTLNVQAVNDAPVGTPLVVTLKEDAGASAIDLWSLFRDADNADSQLTLSLVGSGSSALFSNINIDLATGQLLLESLRDAFGTATITVRATDPQGLSADATLTLNVTPVNDAPVLVTSSEPLKVDGSNVSLPLDLDLVVSDVDSATLTGAILRIVDGVAGRDVLAFTNQNGITGSFDEATSTLTLTGVASVADYQAALRSITYTSMGLSGGSRRVEFSVSDEGLSSAIETRMIDFPESGPLLPPTHEPEPAPTPEPPIVVETVPPNPPRPVTEPPPPIVFPPSDTWGSDPTPIAPPPVAPLPAVVVVPPPIVEAMPVAPEAPPEIYPDEIVIAVPAPALPEPPAQPAPVAAVPPAPVMKVAALHTQKLWEQLDELARELDAQNARPKISVGSVAGLTTTLMSVGYVIWCLRGGSLVATLLTTLPLWRWLDPLPVLDHAEKDRDKNKQNDEDEERIRTMMD